MISLNILERPLDFEITRVDCKRKFVKTKNNKINKIDKSKIQITNNLWKIHKCEQQILRQAAVARWPGLRSVKQNTREGISQTILQLLNG